MKARFAIGAVIGAVAGVVAGVLTAPKSGRETRADLKAKANELKTEAAKKAGSYQSRSKRASVGSKHGTRTKN